MNKIVLIAMLMGLLTSNPCHACIWIYETDLHGNPILAGSGVLFERNHSRTRDQWIDTRERLLASLFAKPDYKVETDLAVVLIHLADYDAAIARLEGIEKDHPGIYVTAVNLGTAYELAGKNDLALHWIKEGITRNADSHQKTEWVHVKILESKLAIEHDPRWMETHPVLGMDFGRGEIPAMPLYIPLDNTGQAQTPEKIRFAIIYQLNERLEFVHAPDPHVADLYFELANLEALIGTLEQSVRELTHADEFGFPNKELIALRIKHYRLVIKQNARKVKRAKPYYSRSGVK